jgi:hypothetical protein
VTAFSRDISTGGIGMLHREQLPNDQVVVSVPLTDDYQVTLNGDVKWCQPVCDDWYFSGARLSRLSMRNAARLLSAVFREGFRRRLGQRQPFFRPITVRNGQGPGSAMKVFGRDISAEGIGLLHNGPLEPGRVILDIPMSQGIVEISVEIRWNRNVGDGWQVSGGKFVTITLDELPSRLI